MCLENKNHLLHTILMLKKPWVNSMLETVLTLRNASKGVESVTIISFLYYKMVRKRDKGRGRLKF